MRERAGQILKIACIVFAALVVLQLARAIRRGNPLASLSIPAVPTLSTNAAVVAEAKSTNAVASKVTAKTGTNAPGSEAGKRGTNIVLAVGSTNANAAVDDGKQGTNTVLNSEKVATNTVATSTPERVQTNAVPRADPVKIETNIISLLESTNTVTNVISGVGLGKPGTNLVVGSGSSKAGTNAVAQPALGKMPGIGGRPEMGMAGMPGAGKKPPELSPETKARVFRIVDSEILGPVIRPQPMALLGLAGNMALLRSPSGQTGLVKEGDSLGELKLISIGINRVLVEHEGQKKEMMIFSGFGSESLLTNQKPTSNETTQK
jgi:hypothetical protein